METEMAAVISIIMAKTEEIIIPMVLGTIIITKMEAQLQKADKVAAA